MSKPEINIPTEFAANGTKVDFPNEKILSGFDPINPDILPGDCLNKFIDDTYKGLNGVLELYDEKVNKSGDTMTGDLTINKDSGIYLIKSSFDSTTTTAPSEFINLGTLAMYDTNDNYTGYVQNSFYTDNTVRTTIGARRIINGVDKNAWLVLFVDSSGNASCSFPNTTCVDGRYVNMSPATTIASNVSINGSSFLSYTLNLPNDGHNYMVWMIAEGDTGTTSGNYINIKLGSDIMTSTTVARATTRTASTVGASGTVCLVVSSSHKIYLSRATNWNGKVSLYMVGYRRIGTNS